MSIQEVSAEQFANSIGESRSEIPLGERSRMMTAVRLALQDLGSSNSVTSSRNERYFAKPGESEWGC